MAYERLLPASTMTTDCNQPSGIEVGTSFGERAHFQAAQLPAQRTSETAAAKSLRHKTLHPMGLRVIVNRGYG